MPSCCFIRADLSEVRLMGEGAPATWTALPSVGDAPPDLDALRARAGQAADWVAKTLGSRKRLAVVAIDTAGSICLWLRSPTDEVAVLAATLRSATQDWGDSIPRGEVQRLTDPAPADSPNARGYLDRLRRPGGNRTQATPAEAHGSAVLSAPLALIRLWLDELDARGVRIDAVASMWHALAASWAAETLDSEPAAVLLHESAGRLVWCWARAGRLLVGGTVLEEQPSESTAEAEPPADPANRAAGRLALDWAAWSAHLGMLPASIVLLGPNADALRPALETRWPKVQVRMESTADALAETLTRAAARRSADADPRHHLVGLTHRPTRAVRTQYRWAAAALVMLAAAVAILGSRMTSAADRFRAAGAAAEADARTLVESLGNPRLLSAPNLVKALESEVMVEGTRPQPKGPPAPRPIFDELRRLATTFAKFEGVRLVQVQIDTKTPITMQANVPDRRTGEEIRVALQQEPGSLTWTEAAGVGADQALRMNGAWK